MCTVTLTDEATWPPNGECQPPHLPAMPGVPSLLLSTFLSSRAHHAPWVSGSGLRIISSNDILGRSSISLKKWREGASALLSPPPGCHLWVTQQRNKTNRCGALGIALQEAGPAQAEGKGERVSQEPGESQSRRRNHRARAGRRDPPDRHGRMLPGPAVCPSRLVPTCKLTVRVSGILGARC